MTRGEEFAGLRALLFAIAYRILGSVAEAEDAVQETWLRYQSSPTVPTSTKAFLSAVVTRVSIDVLRSARVRRETYVRQWLPEPLLVDPYSDPARSAELADSVSMAALLLLERLTPLEPLPVEEGDQEQRKAQRVRRETGVRGLVDGGQQDGALGREPGGRGRLAGEPLRGGAGPGRIQGDLVAVRVEQAVSRGCAVQVVVQHPVQSRSPGRLTVHRARLLGRVRPQ